MMKSLIISFLLLIWLPVLAETNPQDHPDSRSSEANVPPLNLDWKLNKKPWAIYRGEHLPESLQELKKIRTLFEQKGFRFFHFSDQEIPQNLKRIAKRKNALNLAYYDGSHRQKISLDSVNDLEKLSKRIKTYQQKNTQNRLKKLERHINRQIRVLVNPKASEQKANQSTQELIAIAEREKIKGLKPYVQKLLIERQNVQMTIRASSAKLNTLDTLNVTGGVGIERPQMGLQSIHTTVQTP